MSVKSPDPADIHVGMRIRVARNLKGISQTALATALGVTFQQVQKYEKGVNRVGAGRLNTIGNFLQQPLSFFYEGLTTGSNEGVLDPLIELGLIPSGVKLARAFVQITDPEKRRHILEHAQAYAEAG